MVAGFSPFVGLLVALQSLSALASGFDAFPVNSKRTLAAASRRSHQQARSDTISFYNSADLIYADGDNVYGGHAFAAKVSVSSERPIFVLEDFEHLFKDVTCDASSITLVHPAASRLWQRDTFDGLVDGHIITSHYGCNARNSRIPYAVKNIEYASYDTVKLVIVPVTWKDSFDTFKVDMGYTEARHELRKHIPRHLAARQASGVSATSAFNASIIPSVINPKPRPTSDSKKYDFNLAGSLVNKSLGPFDTPVGVVPVEIGCVNCTTFGTVDVTYASFEYTCGFHPNTSDFSSCISGGANVTTQGLGAHMELSASLTNSFTFSVPISQLQAKFSIKIPEIGSASVVFGNVLTGGYNMDGHIGITYGFDLTVPDGSGVMVEVANPGNSSINGFQDSQVTALPVQTDTDIQSLEMYIALRAIIKASFDFEEHLEVGGEVGAGVYVDAPVLSANITPVTNVDSSCNPLSPAALLTPGLNVSTSAVNVNFSAGWDFGAFFDADATFFHQKFIKNDHDVDAEGSYPIGSLCVDFKNTSTVTQGPGGAVDNTVSAASPAAIWRSLPLCAGLFVVSSIFALL